MPAQDRPKERPRRDADPPPEGLRERKKRETRQLISDIATRLFAERGFDEVTIDEVAAAANVSKMTVFNYFARKEDLLFDRGKDAQELARAALLGRGSLAPVPALRRLVHDLVDEPHPLVKMNAGVAGFWRTVAGSSALRAHTRKLAAELERDLGLMLAESVGAPAGDPVASLIATLLVGTWRVAFREGLRRRRSSTAAVTREAFVELLDRGFDAAAAAAAGSPYVGHRGNRREG